MVVETNEQMQPTALEDMNQQLCDVRKRCKTPLSVCAKGLLVRVFSYLTGHRSHVQLTLQHIHIIFYTVLCCRFNFKLKWFYTFV